MKEKLWLTMPMALQPVIAHLRDYHRQELENNLLANSHSPAGLGPEGEFQDDAFPEPSRRAGSQLLGYHS